MSDPLKNVDVEDVLSSIRRLVSETGKGGDAEPAATVPVSDKLVLTPALRVSTPDKPSREPLELPSEMIADAEPEAPPPEPATAPDAVAKTKTGEPALMFSHRARPLVTDAAGEAERASEAAVDAGAETLREQMTRAFDPSEKTAVEPETGTDETVAEEAPSEVPDLESQLAEWETVVAGSEEQYEPDAAGDGDYAGTEVEAMAWQDLSDDSAPDPAPKPAPQPSPRLEQVVDSIAADVAAGLQGKEGDDPVIDEEALRDLVGDIVRAELQGALGERITRNVRKLVRREIHRALSAQSLE